MNYSTDLFDQLKKKPMMVLRRIGLPYIHLFIDFGWIHLSTRIMARAYEQMSFIYFELNWRFFKWNGQIDLYSPDHRRETKRETVVREGSVWAVAIAYFTNRYLQTGNPHDLDVLKDVLKRYEAWRAL